MSQKPSRTLAIIDEDGTVTPLRLVDALLWLGLARSLRDARDAIKGGSVWINWTRVGRDRAEHVLTEADLIAQKDGSRIALLRRGKEFGVIDCQPGSATLEGFSVR